MKGDNFHKAVFFLISAVVLAGVVYAFTSPESIMLQDFKATPVFMKVIGFGLFLSAAIAVGLYSKADTGGWKSFGWIISIALLLVFGLLFILGFGQFTL